MKKILSILVSVLFTLSSFGQGSLNLEHQSGTIQKVGDEFVMKIQYYTGDQGDATLLQFDYEYNNKLLELTEFNWASGVPSDYSKTRNQWTGYKYNNRPDTEATDMDLQYQWWQSEAGNNSYSANQDFNVNRITVQGTTAWTNGNVIVTIKFKVKDNFGTNYSDYSNVIALNWANIKKADGSQLQVTRNGDYSLGSIQGGNAGDVTLNLKTANTAGYADYGYTIKYDGESVKTGDFDAGGQAVVSGLENDKIYSIEVNLSELPEYLDEVVTVADLAKVFAEAIGAGSGPSGTTSTWDYHVQAVIGDVVGDDNKVDFQDSYEIMAYLQSITTGNTNRITQANATYDKWGIEGTYGDNTQSSMFLNTFTLTDSNQSSKTINVAHGLVGDVNFTHSYEPSAEGAAKSTQASARNSMGVQYSSVQGADPLYKSEEANLDLVSEIKDDGTVEFTIEMDVENLIGTQFNVKYNTTVLTLDNVIFDTGNEMTNFSNIDGDKIRIGSFDQNFTATVKTGTPYKLIFTPNEAIQNTSGLITFKVTEGVKDDGTQVNFIIN